MKKLLILLTVFLILILGVSAELDHFTTATDIVVINGSVEIIFEDLQTRSYSYSSTVNETVTVNLYRNTSCKEDELFDYLKESNEMYTEALGWREKYYNYSAENTILREIVYGEGNETYQAKFANCNSLLTTTRTNYNTCNTKLTEYENKTNPAIFYILAFIAGCVVYHIWTKKSYAPPPIAKLPPNR